MDKQTQRKELRSACKNIEDRDGQSRAIAELTKRVQLPSGSICIYNSLPSEVDTKELIEHFRKSRSVYLPVVEGDDILLVKVGDDTKYVEGRWGISQPIGQRLEPCQVLPSVTVTPLLGVDKKLNRLGKGKGYYDRYFASVDTYKVGLAFNQQVVDEVVCDEWDKPLDMLITPSGVIKAGDELKQ